MNLEQARKLKNGQHIQVNNFGRWIDALFVRIDFMDRGDCIIYAIHMGIDKNTKAQASQYGTYNFFDLYDVRLPMEEK